MNMQKIDLYSLSACQLDWLVDMARMRAYGDYPEWIANLEVDSKYAYETDENNTRWSMRPENAAELIETYAIAVRKDSKGTWFAMTSDDLGDGAQAPWAERSFVPSRWAKVGPAGRCVRYKGSTMAQAVCRCFVGWVLGLQQGPSGRMVEVPEILGGD